MKTKELTVHLQIELGRKGTYGDVIEERFINKLTYGGLAWRNYLKNCLSIGVYKMSVAKVFEKTDGKYEEISTPDYILKEVKDACTEVVAVTPEEKMAEMEKQMAEMRKLIEGKNLSDEEERNEAVIAYEKHFGHKPKGNPKTETIYANIEADKNKK